MATTDFRWAYHPSYGLDIWPAAAGHHAGWGNARGLQEYEFAGGMFSPGEELSEYHAVDPKLQQEGIDHVLRNYGPFAKYKIFPVEENRRMYLGFHQEHQAGAYPTDWTHKWIWADGKMDHCDAQLGQPNYSHHGSMLHEMGYNAYTGQPENYIGGLYNANTGAYSSHGYWGRVPSEEELKAELEARTLPDHTGSYFLETIASDRYTGPAAKIVHIPTGDMGEPEGRIPGLYDSNTNTFYHGDSGGSHYPLVDHLRQPETDDDYLDDTVNYWDYMGDHIIPTIYFPVDSIYNGNLMWAQRIKPELQRQFMDAMERHVKSDFYKNYHNS